MNMMSEVLPVNPVAPYLGGKRNLAKRLVAMISAMEHQTYAEPFVGMGGIFLRRGLRPKAEIINDISEDVATFYRVLQHHYQPFLDMIKWQISSRAGFERLIRIDPSTLTDMQRAARFLYLQRQAFGGKVTGRNFGVSVDRPSRFDVTKVGPMLEALHERMAGVIIERLPWRDFVERYDRAGTLFYLDPPYFDCEDDYGKAVFDKGQFEIMADVLSKIKGRFLLSLNDKPEVRRIFQDFKIEAVDVRYTIAGSEKAKVAGEVIIGN